MDFKYENQGTNTYLVYQIAENDIVDSMSLGMLTNNKIPGLAPVIFTQNDATKYIYYNVSAHISVKQFFLGPVNKKRLVGVFNGIVNALLSAEDYMINANSIIMDLDYIFADVSTCETVLICLPITGIEMPQVDLVSFFKNIMFSTQFDQTENCDHVAKIMNYLNSAPVFSLTDFKTLLDSIDVDFVQQPVVNKVNQPEAISPSVTQTVQVEPQMQKNEQKKIVQPVVKPVQQVSPPQPIQNKPMQQSVQQPVPQVQTIPSNEKKISMLGLLMHYNKENVELYKQQKAQKKNANSNVEMQTNVKSKKNSASKKFATPGQESNPGFAIPQQNNNLGFAVPGQQNSVVSSTVLNEPQQATPAQQSFVPKATTEQQQAFIPRQVPQGQGANFGETTVLGGGNIGETTVLTAANNPTQVATPHLIRKKNNERISLNKPVFRIGKERSYVDCFIGDNTAISRSHANFITRDGEYFVVDTNSTNHTFLNGTMLQSNVETQISHGDIIRLANEDFEFNAY